MKKQFAHKTQKPRKLRLESLESRQLLAADLMHAAAALESPSVVVNSVSDDWDLDDDVVTLREALYTAQDGDVIAFDESLAGQTYLLTQGGLDVNAAVTVDASALWNAETNAPGLTIDAGGENNVFTISSGSEESPVVFKGLTIANGNSAYIGGGITLYGGYLNIEDCVLSDNSGVSGGGINLASGTVNATNCAFEGNAASNNGGAIYVYSGTFNATNCTIEGNAAKNGAGIYHSGGTIVATNCLVVGNVATNEGGGVRGDTGGALVNCTVVDNSAAYGGGVYNEGRVEATNSIVLLNTATTAGADVYLDDDVAQYYDGATIGSNNLSSYTAWTGADNVEYDATAPLFVDAANGDYRLAPNSQAIGLGDSSVVMTATDLAGNERIQRDSVDLGAYEYTPAPPVTRVVTTLDDSQDPDDELLSLREALGAANDGDTIAFDDSLFDGSDVQTLSLSLGEFTIDKTITIDAGAFYSNGVQALEIDAEDQSRVFNVAQNGDLTLVGVMLRGGKSYDNGGAIYVAGAANLAQCHILESEAYGSNGGAIYVAEGATLTATDLFVNANNAGCGGGIYLANGANAALYNVAVKGNTATNGGGGIYAANAPLVLVNCDVVENAAGFLGGSGLYLYNNGGDSSAVAYNSIVVSNNEDDVCLNSGVFSAYNVLSSFADWSNAGEEGVVNYTCDAAVDANEIFQDVASGDLRLAKNSPAINAGNNDYAVGPNGEALETDLNGNTRIVGGTVDLGAYESPEIPSIVVTIGDDVVDPYDEKISLREAISYAQSGDTITFDPALSGAILLLDGTQIAINKAITIDATSVADDGATGVTIDAQGASRVFNVDYGGDLTLVGLTLQNGVGADWQGGGAINLTGYTSATLKNCVVVDCQGTRGGAINVAQSSYLTAVNVLIQGCSATNGDGGAIYAIYNTFVDLYNTTIVNNAATGAGDGICVYNSASPKVNAYNSIVVGNGDDDVSGPISAFNVLSRYTSWKNAEDEGVVNYKYDAAKPLFNDSESGDYSLAENSQAIDRGADELVETETELAGATRIQGASVDLGPFEYACDFTVDYDQTTRVATLSWTELPEAASYTVKISKDGGQTWLNYRKGLETNTQEVKGLYANHSYVFQVVGVNAEGEFSLNYEKAIEPINLVYTNTPYAVNSAKSVVLQAATPENVEIRWYSVTDAGLVEIEAAYNQTSYAPTNGDYDLRVIATGLEGTPSEGCVSEITISKPAAPTVTTLSFSNRNAAATAVTSSWDAIDGAASYTVKISKDDGQTWITKAKNVAETEYRLLNVTSGAMFRVYGCDANGKQLKSYAEGTFEVGVTTLDAVAADPYDTLARTFDVEWNLVDGAASYAFQRNDGNGWKKVATVDVENGVITAATGPAELVGDQIVYTVKMLDAGATGNYRVLAIGESGATLDSQELSYTSFGLELDHDAYATSGDVLTATTAPETNAAYQWFVSEDAGETWTTIEGATNASYTISAEEAANLYSYKLVATTDDSSSVVYANPSVLDAPTDVVYAETGSETDDFTFVFAPVDGVQDYQIEYRLADATNPVWLNLTNVTWTTNNDGQIVGTHVHAANYEGATFRVRSVANASRSEWTLVEEASDVSNSLLDEAFAELFAEDKLFVEV